MKFQVFHTALLGLVLTGCTGPFGSGTVDSQFMRKGSLSIRTTASLISERCVEVEVTARSRSEALVVSNQPVVLEFTSDASALSYYLNEADCRSEAGAIDKLTIEPGVVSQKVFFNSKQDGTINLSVSAAFFVTATAAMEMLRPYNSGSNQQFSHFVPDTVTGKIYLSGNFTEYRGYPVTGIARVDENGAFDPSFQVGSGLALDDVAGTGYFAAPLPDGRVYIAGRFNSIDGTPAHNLVRLNHDGSVDPTFAVNDGGVGAEGFNNTIYSVFVDGDGDILVGGDFTQYQSTPCPKLAVLDAAGDLINCPVPNVNNSVFGFERGRSADGQFNNSIYAIGFFTVPNGRIIRLDKVLGEYAMNADFNDGGANRRINAFTVTDDGKLLLGGDFDAFNAEAGLLPLIKFDPETGTLDAGFLNGLQGPTGATNKIVTALAIEPTTRDIFVSGAFTTFNSDISASNLVRISSSGELRPYRLSQPLTSGSLSNLNLFKGNLFLVGSVMEQQRYIRYMGTAKLSETLQFVD